MLYKITGITTPDGTPRTDGRYPERIGRTCRFLAPPEYGYSMFIAYERDQNGEPYPGVLRTSTVLHVDKDESGAMAVETVNSIYHFEPIAKPITHSMTPVVA